VLATVQAAVHLTQSETVEGFKEAIEGKIQALAYVHTLFVSDRMPRADSGKPADSFWAFPAP
jgi:hypothetical protein